MKQHKLKRIHIEAPTPEETTAIEEKDEVIGEKELMKALNRTEVHL